MNKDKIENALLSVDDKIRVAVMKEINKTDKCSCKGWFILGGILVAIGGYFYGILG